MQKTEIRQGDLLIYPITKIPKSATLITSKTLAYGEITGHHHTIFPIGGAKVNVLRDLDKMYFEVTDGKAVLLHTDEKKIDMKRIYKTIEKMFTRVKNGGDFHKPVTFDEGTYEVEVEHEYNPFIKELTKVVD